MATTAKAPVDEEDRILLRAPEVEPVAAATAPDVPVPAAPLVLDAVLDPVADAGADAGLETEPADDEDDDPVVEAADEED